MQRDLPKGSPFLLQSLKSDIIYVCNSIFFHSLFINLLGFYLHFGIIFEKHNKKR